MHLGINRFRCTCTKPWRVKLAVQDAEALLERNLRLNGTLESS